jgi:hypothetical protein
MILIDDKCYPIIPACARTSGETPHFLAIPSASQLPRFNRKKDRENPVLERSLTAFSGQRLMVLCPRGCWELLFS